MIKVYGEEKRPIKSWVTDIEDGALEQARNLANLPFLFKHVALMPDCHQGYGMPIGGVIATEGVVIPNAVGVDIGCGMCAQKTDIKVEDFSTETLKEIMGEIRKRIPVGFSHRKEQCEKSEMPGGIITYGMDAGNSPTPICTQQYDKARYQLGTLGGGNHFIEIQKGSDGFIWIMIHSGSRNLGFKVAKHYNDIAKSLNKEWHSSVDLKQDLAFLPIQTNEATDYMDEMKYCLDFAYNNRVKMMNDIIDIFKEKTNCNFNEFHNIHHNYAAFENHFGKNVIVHRKGATSAKEGEIGIIPGSQGTCSYIVRGLGNPESFKSCSHGAGRLMGRKQAQKVLDLEIEQRCLNEKGVIHSIRNVKDLDEAPSAYKDIIQVMDNQIDLVEIVIKLEPLGVVKG